MSDTCHQCGDEFKIIARHWSRGSCDYEPLTDFQKEVATGLLMGDGSIDAGDESRKPYLRTNMTAPNYLSYLDDIFGVFGNGVSLRRSASESAKISPNSRAKEENYSALYKWNAMRHPDFKEFRAWYDTGEKVWPETIELTPTVLKHWYCGDGHYENSQGHNYISIALQNERDNLGKVDEMFNRAGLPEPYHKVSESNCEIVFTVKQSEALWEHMGEPLPDFEYKWPKPLR